ncbi:class I SAM-dependent methyltransferase [Paenibacillus apiarius]|uniref:class I SAM-dependent methyltransferase n=1 Tax=Paenibacillus apiarius TaxID=46240 RepID=UPI00197D3697|nr:class I SAM-dependent methyltransferase [Paenibacillus apiarius]MBN3525254.1 class I SAM-dependent methyltransferase [Paenibacillus apiarius]
MSTFYEVLLPFYDEIFPANDKQISFLSSCFPAASTLLDVGAGTGNTAIALAAAGYHLTATEPEQGMLPKIIEKAARDRLPIRVLPHSMQQVSRVNERFDGIYCIGNTLPHLDNLQEVRVFLQDAYHRIKENGKLVIQTVNFEKVLLRHAYSFPVIEKETFRFTRQYKLQNGKIRFTATLEDHSDIYSNTLLLYPVTKNQLQSELQECGFHSITAYGDYAKSPYNSEAPGLVLVAVK